MNNRVRKLSQCTQRKRLLNRQKHKMIARRHHQFINESFPTEEK